MSTVIELYVSGHISLRVDQVWPDGNAPAEVTANDVKAVMEAAGDKATVLDDWCLMDDIEVTAMVARPNPNAGQLSLEGGDPQPDILQTDAEVWFP